MKYNIVFKFIAVMLCALFLLTAAGSGIGIIAFTTSDFYEKTVDEVYNEAVGSLSDAFAGQIAANYASRALGGCPEEMLDYYGRIFTPGYYGYVLRDADGNILDELEVPEHTEARYFSIDLTGRRYQKLISITPESELYSTEPTVPPEFNVYQDQYYVYDAVPPGGAEVQEIFVDFLDGSSESCGSEAGLGMLFYERSGEIRFNALDAYYFLSDTGPVTHISFLDAQGSLLYEAGSDDGSAVGIVYENEDGILCYESLRQQDDAVPATTIPVTVPDTTAAVTEIPTEVPTEAPKTDFALSIIDNTAQRGVQVACITMFDAYLNAYGPDSNEIIGYLYPDTSGTITFQSYNAMDIPECPAEINHIAFLDAEGWLLYEVKSPDGVGGFHQDNNGCLIFTTTVTPADVAAAEAAAAETPTEVPSEADVPDAANIIAEVTDPTESLMETQPAAVTYYWDSELQEQVQAEYTYEEIPEGYTLELWLLPGAYELDPIYDLLNFLWQYRTDLFYILGVSVLLFAVFAVYLCCAAGRKPGREEVKAEGLNCLPLDVYLAGGFLAICGLVILCVEGGYYLLRNSPHVIAPYIMIAGYIAALIIVGFCFACAAQFKTPGGYWWKNTLCARFIRMICRLAVWLERFLGAKFFPFLGRILKFFWKHGKRLFIALFRYTEQFLTWFVRFTTRSVKFLWKHGSRLAVTGFHGLETALTWLGRGLGKIAQRAYAWLHAFFSLLPVTWQWLLVGFGMFLLMALVFATNGEEFLVVICLGICIGIILYGAHCFGILWDSTRKMSKGDLETKVDDRLMVGSFKEFAGDLNALADVAVVAAQKQLKSERMKTELITNVSHDIKTPLTSIINYVDLLQKPHTDEEQEIYLEVLSRQSLQMKKLLEDLIEMSKASTGNMAVDIIRLNANEAVSQALGEFSDKLEKSQLIPIVRQPDTDVYMQADGRLVWRVLSNVLSNVVKYALPGTRVYIDLTVQEEKVLISVKNISREPLNVSADELMERFVRGDASRNTEGSGLGLNIAQSLMEIQKGKLQLLVDGDLFKVTLTFPSAE